MPGGGEVGGERRLFDRWLMPLKMSCRRVASYFMEKKIRKVYYYFFYIKYIRCIVCVNLPQEVCILK